MRSRGGCNSSPSAPPTCKRICPMMLACRVDAGSARPPSPGELVTDSEENGLDGREYAEKLVELLRAHGGGLLCLQRLRRTANVEVQRAAHRQLREQLTRRLWGEVLARSSLNAASGCLRESVELALRSILVGMLEAPVCTPRAFGRWLDDQVFDSVAEALQRSGPCMESHHRKTTLSARAIRPPCCSARRRERDGDYTHVG